MTAIAVARDRFGMRIIEFSIQRDHIHLILEAEDAERLGKALRALGIRIAKRLNALFGRTGSVFRERYHLRTLTTPKQVRHAIAYVLCNFHRHRENIGDVPPDLIDECSSGLWFDGWHDSRRFPRAGPSPVSPARTWLLRIGWRRWGLVRSYELPGTKRVADARYRAGAFDGSQQRMEDFAQFSIRAFASAASDERVRLRRALELALTRAVDGAADFHDAVAAVIQALRAAGHELRPVARGSAFSHWCPVDDNPEVFGLFVWFAQPRATASWARRKGLADDYAEGGVTRLAEELARGGDPNECDPLGVPIVCDAASRNDVDALRLLLDRGVDVESSCSGTTPLIYAANAGNTEAVRFLLSRGANRRATNDDGYTAAGRVPGADHALVALLSSDD